MEQTILEKSKISSTNEKERKKETNADIIYYYSKSIPNKQARE